MGTRVLSMSARLGPEEPIFAQLKPVLGPQEPSLFPGPGPELKQQQQQQQPPVGGGARIPVEEMVQTQCEMEKYLTPQLPPPPPPIIPEHKKYHRDSASVVDQFFTDSSDGLPYCVNMSVCLSDLANLRTGLLKPPRPSVAQIKTEPVTVFSHQSVTAPPVPSPTQALPEFTSIFSPHQTPDVNNLFIKQELPTPDIHLSVSVSLQGQLYQLLSSPDLDMPSQTTQAAVMDILNNVSMSSAMAGLNTLSSAMPQTTMKQFQGIPQCTYTMPNQFLPQLATYFPPSPQAQSLAVQTGKQKRC